MGISNGQPVVSICSLDTNEKPLERVAYAKIESPLKRNLVVDDLTGRVIIRTKRSRDESSSSTCPTPTEPVSKAHKPDDPSGSTTMDEDNNYDVDDRPYADSEGNFVGLVTSTSTPFHLHSSVLHLDEGKRLPVIAGRPSSSSLLVAPSTSPALIEPSFPESLRPAVDIQPVRREESPVPHFFLFSSDFDQSITNRPRAFLAKGTAFDEFVLTLSDGYIIVERPTDAPFDTDHSVIVSTGDKWGQSVTLGGGLGISKITLTLKIDQHEVATVSSWQAEIGAGSGTISFKSDDAPAILGADLQDKVLVLEEYGLGILGLSEELTDMTLPQVAGLFGQTWLTDKSFDANPLVPIDTISNLVKFKLSKNKNSRSGLYFRAYEVSTTYLRLQFDLTTATNELLTWLRNEHLLPSKSADSIVIENFAFTLLKTSTTASNFSRWMAKVTDNYTLSGSIKFGEATDSPRIQFWLAFEPKNVMLVLRFPKLSIEQIFGWLRARFSFAEQTDNSAATQKLEPGAVTGLVPQDDVSVSVRQVEVQIGGPSNFHCNVVLQLEVFGTVFMTSLAFPALRLRADLWTQKPVTDQRPRWVPWYESYKEFSPYDSEALTGSLNLKTLVENSGDKSNLPEPPHHSMFDLREAYFEAAKPASGQLHLELFAKVYVNPPDGDIPMVWPKSFEVFGAYVKTASGASWIIALSTTLTLTSRNPTVDSVKPALLTLGAAKTNDSWIFTGHAENLDFGAMYKYFDASARDGVMDILEGIGIPYLDVEYVHGPSKKLTVNSAFKIKKFLLLFDYTYEKLGAGIGKGTGMDTGLGTGVGTASTSNWKLHAALGPSMETGELTSTVSLLGVISEFVPQNDAILSILGEVPFVSDIKIKTADSSSGNKPMEFEVSSTAKALVMWLRMEALLPVGTISLMFVQYKYKPAATGTGAARPPKTQDLKRYIRVRLDKLPDLPKIPIVGQIKQPVDAIDYVFVQDSTTTGGLTQAEISEINQSLPRDSTVRFKQADSQIQAQSEQNFKKDEASAEKSAGVSLRCGHHFIVITDDKVILDHVFGNADSQKPTPPPKPTAALAVPGDLTLRREVVAPKGEASVTDSGATFGPNKKSMGALSISNVGLQVKDKHLFILLDAKVKLGTIEMAIEGFGIGLPLEKITKPKDIKGIGIDDFKTTLTGLGVMYNQPPILIAGGFKHEETDKYESYMGGLLITIPPYSIMAVGAYRRTISPDFKSVFLFGRLDGPLFTLEFAEISGVAISFGYNYNLRSPRGSDIENFPLLSKQQSAGAGDPLDMLIGTGPSTFGSWLTAQKDMNFFSIGLKADALQVLTIETALIFGIGVDQFKISIVGRATAVLPPSKTKGSKPPLTFLYAELGLVATLDVTGGSLIVEAQLSSNSYILSPECNLRGGFALCYWFGNSHYAGDWVFSVGGYHPAYKPPPHWPVPPRVGISWELSKMLRVSGEGFFAITPKAIMGGGRLLATFQAGPIFADFEAYASFLINFKPFFFVAKIGVRISVGARIHIGIITISISGSVSAELFLQGPPFGGYVNVDFKIVHIKIKFGNSDPKPKALDWSGFLEAVRKPGLTGAPEAGNQKGRDTPDIVVIALSAGAATETLEKTSQATGEPWAVRAGSFRFRVESKVAIGVGVIDSGLKNKQPGERKDDHKPIYARLTQSQTPLESTLTVKVELPDEAETDTGNEWRVLPIVKALPKALWDKYTTSEDPTASNGGDNQIGSILTNNGPQDTTIPHVVGYNFIPPKPTLPTLNLPSFNAITAMSEGVFQQAEPPMGATLVRNPLLPPPKPNEDDVEMRPRLSVSAEGEGVPKLKEWWIEDAKGELTKWDAEKEWEAVKEAWGEVDGDVQGLTDIVVGAFGWASPVGKEEKKDDGASRRTGDGGAASSGAKGVAGSGDGAKTGSPTAASPLLSGAKPTALLNEFEKYYMSCPWVTVI